MDQKNTKCSSRIKLLIKNMFDNKNSGWKKTIESSKEIKKKDEIERLVSKQAAESAAASNSDSGYNKLEPS